MAMSTTPPVKSAGSSALNDLCTMIRRSDLSGNIHLHGVAIDQVRMSTPFSTVFV